MSRKWSSLVVLALVVVGLTLTAGCAKKYAAEKDGKDVGQAVCDVKDADNQTEASDALADVKKQLDDVRSNYAVFTQEDRNDITENLNDLVEHVVQGNDALVQQDLTVIRRSLENIREDLGDAGKAAVDGFFEGVDDCVSGY